MGDGTRERLLYHINHLKLKGVAIPLKTKVAIQIKPNNFGQLLFYYFRYRYIFRYNKFESMRSFTL